MKIVFISYHNRKSTDYNTFFMKCYRINFMESAQACNLRSRNSNGDSLIQLIYILNYRSSFDYKSNTP